MPAFSIGTAVTSVSTTQEFPLGFEFEEAANGITGVANTGEKVWVYVQNGEGASSFTAGLLVQRKASTTTKIGTIGSTTALPPHGYLGVAQHTIPAASYGFILRRGWGTVLADTGNISANQGLTPGNAVAGAFDSTATATVATVGFAPTAITAAATGLAWIDIPG